MTEERFLVRFLFETPWWRLVGILFVLMILKTGIWYYPPIGTLIRLSADPFFLSPDTSGVTSFIHFAWFSAFLGWLTGLNSDVSFVLFHACFSIAFFWGVAWLLKRELSARHARVALVLFVAIPVSYVSFFWFGQDSLTLFLMLLVLIFHRHLFVVFALGVLLGLQHFEQAFVATFAALGAIGIGRLLPFSQPINWAPFTLVLLGVGLGRILFLVTLWWFDIPITATRLGYLEEHQGSITFNAARVLPTALWSSMGAVWLVLIRLWAIGRDGVVPTVSVLLLSLIMWVVVDHTRVFAMCSLFLIANLLLLNPVALERVSRQMTATVFLVWLLVPVTFVWGSGASGSLIWHDIQIISNLLFGYPDVSIFEEWGPF